MSLQNPQLEDGFTPIANAIMDALARTRFSGYERSVLDFLFRKTYGWSKKSDLISLSQFVDATRISKPNIVHTLNRLVNRNIISRTVVGINNGSLTRYEFNKHFGEWISLLKSTTPLLSLLKSTIEPLLKSTPTISIEKTISKRFRDKDSVGLLKSTTHDDEVPPDLPEPSVDDLAAEVLSYLNEKTKRKYRNAGLIPARLNETSMHDGKKAPTYTVDDCKKVIDVKCSEWMGTEQEKFLTPVTLFRPANFDRYLNQGGKTGGFSEFLDSHPDLDYRKFPKESQFARSSKLLTAFKIAEDAGVTLTKEDYDLKAKAIGVKSDEAHTLIKEKK